MNNLRFFNGAVAEEFGLAAGILFQEIAHWVRENEAKGVNRIDGRTWMYRTQKEFHEQHPYLSVRQIGDALKELEEAKLVETGCLNKKGYDRTRWYTMGQRAAPYLADCQPAKIDSCKCRKSTVPTCGKCTTNTRGE